MYAYTYICLLLKSERFYVVVGYLKIFKVLSNIYLVLMVDTYQVYWRDLKLAIGLSGFFVIWVCFFFVVILSRETAADLNYKTFGFFFYFLTYI